MTREDAIKKLEQSIACMKWVDDFYADCVNGEALDMAVRSLKAWNEIIEYLQACAHFYRDSEIKFDTYMHVKEIIEYKMRGQDETN